MTQSPYGISVRNKMLDRWNALGEEFPEEMESLKVFLKTQPTNTRVTNGKAKKLKGDLKHLYQYDVSYVDRVRYEVDRTNRIVRVVFAKGHP